MLRIVIICWLVLGFFLQAMAKPLPSKLSSAILLKLLAMEESRFSQRKLSVHVIGDSPLAKQLALVAGKKVDRMQIQAVTASSDLPTNIPNAIIVGNVDKQALSKIVDYANAHQIVLIADSPELLSSGVLLAIYQEDGLPSIQLNVNESRRLGLKWNPKVLSVVKLFEQ